MITVHNPLTGHHHPDAGHAAPALQVGEPVTIGQLTVQCVASAATSAVGSR